jgi:hypothetical protein
LKTGLLEGTVDSRTVILKKTLKKVEVEDCEDTVKSTAGYKKEKKESKWWTSERVKHGQKRIK